jgi:hypothetical protein
MLIRMGRCKGGGLIAVTEGTHVVVLMETLSVT